MDRLKAWADIQPRQPAIVYLADGDQELDRLDFGSLYKQVDQLATWLEGKVPLGERLLLATHSEVNYLIGLLACLHSGVVAVPTLTPLNSRAISRIQAHGEDAGACALLVDPWILARRDRSIGLAGNWVHRLPWLNLEDAFGQSGPVALNDAPRLPKQTLPDQLAYLQYTSGSTNRPRGVMVTHANLAAQLGRLERAFNHRPGSVICNWMPLFHDFGLIMSLQALYCGGTAVLLPSVPTVQRPRRWLQAISDYGAVTSAAPNFMFDRCIERIRPNECEGLDLSSWRHAMNGAEPIRPGTIRNFTERFRSQGFHESAWVMAYGLAEATLVVSMAPEAKGFNIEAFDPEALFDKRAQVSSRGRPLVSCGRPLEEGSVSIVGPDSKLPSPPGVIGEIWVASSSVTAGYWGHRTETDDSFDAQLDDRQDDRRYLRTGDLGFLRHGELYITGRLKDLIIVRGENHYPQDIELTVAQAHPDLEANAGAAFSIDSPEGERLAVVQEARRGTYQRLAEDAVFTSVRHAVAENHGLDTAYIVLLRPGGLPRTSSGKVQRRACRQAWLEGRLPVLAEWTASGEKPVPATAAHADPLESEILATCRRLLGTDRIDPHTSLFEYGVDSLKAAEILLVLEEHWKVSLDLADFADRSSVALLAETIRNNPEKPHPTNRDQPFFLGDAGDEATPPNGRLISQIGHYVAVWDGKRQTRDSMLIGRNCQGAAWPLFWVFQGQQEFINLSGRLGPNQPLYGMRSGHQVMDYTEANIQALATRYRREIEQVHPHGPYLLGGNCQGGLVALAIAQQLWRLQKPVALLCLMEWAFPPQPYHGRVALFWGEESWQKNPFFRFHNPELYWRRAFGAYTLDIVAGGHGEFFSGPNLEALADRLAVRLREAADEPLALLPASAFRASCHPINPPSHLRVRQRYRLKVEIRNLGPIDWAPTGLSGLQFGNHWLDHERRIVSWLDGVAPLPAVSAGAAVIVELPVHAPPEAGTYLLQLDLAEEGVAWFSERGVEALAIPVSVEGA